MDAPVAGRKIPQMTSSLHLKAWRKSRGWTQERVADAIGIANTTYSRFESNTRNVATRYLERLAQLYGVSAGDLFTDPSTPENQRGLMKVQVIGAVQAGAWQEAFQWDPEDRFFIVVPPLPDGYLDAYALQLKGPSMDQVYPEDSFVVCVPVWSFKGELRTLDHVVVERRDHDLTEATVKELRYDDDGRALLWPRSSHPDHQKPVSLPGPHQTGAHDMEIRITGVVIGSFRFHPRPDG